MCYSLCGLIFSSAPPECPLPDILPACSAALPRCLPASVNLTDVGFGAPASELPVIPLLPKISLFVDVPAGMGILKKTNGDSHFANSHSHAVRTAILVSRTLILTTSNSSYFRLIW